MKSILLININDIYKVRVQSYCYIWRSSKIKEKKKKKRDI